MSFTMESNNVDSSCNNISTVSNDIVLNITSYLGSRDLVSLALTCRRFGIVKEGNEDNLVNKAAQDIIKSKWTSDDERHQLPKYNEESWIGLYRELEVLRSPLFFDSLFGQDINHYSNSYCMMKKPRVRIVSFSNSTAISNHIMRCGKHHVTFECTGDMSGVSLGIVRPHLSDWENLVCNKTERWGGSDVHYCALCLENGRYHYRNEKGIGHSLGFIGADWDHYQYQRPAPQKIRHIGMTLDYAEGTVTVFKDGQRLGGMMYGKLSGEYCWFVKGEATLSQGRTMVSIERGNKSQAFISGYIPGF